MSDPRGTGFQPVQIRTLAERLYAEPYLFDFFQAVRLLERMRPDSRPVGRAATPASETVRFRAHQSLVFPPSAIQDLTSPTVGEPQPAMTVAFMGLTGPSGVLPRHYTELLIKVDRESKGAEKYALRDWLDLFNHRWISLFYRAWEKYRFFIPYGRGEAVRPEPDTFTASLYSLVGLGQQTLRGRLNFVGCRGLSEAWPRGAALTAGPRSTLGPGTQSERPAATLAKINDLATLYYSGLLSQRPRSAVNLQALLHDYFQLPVEVQQFQGQWLRLDTASQTALRGKTGNNQLGESCVLGERVWDVQGKIRLRLGPLTYEQFQEFLPDRQETPARKAFFLLSHWVRLFVGPELDFDVQLVLQAAETPACQLTSQAEVGPRLGWNTWLTSRVPPENPADAVFAETLAA